MWLLLYDRSCCLEAPRAENFPLTYKRGGSLVDPLRQDLQNADGDVAAGE